MTAGATASVLAGLAAGASCPAVFLLLLRDGTGPSTAAAAVTALAALAHLPGGPAAGSRGLSAGAAGVLAAGLLALPLMGAKATLAAALACAAASLALRLWLAARLWKAMPQAQPPARTPAGFPIIFFCPALLLAAAASSGWVRLESLLVGNWSYGQTLTLAALLAGAGPGWWAGRTANSRLEESLGDQDGPPIRWGGLALSASGLWGILILHFMGFVGLNAGDGEYLQTPLRHAEDALFLMGQPCLALASWSFLTAMALSALASDGQGSGGLKEVPQAGRWKGLVLAVLAAAGPFAGAGLGSAFGPETAFLAPNVLLMVLGIAAAGPAALWQEPVLSKAAAACLALGLWLSWTGVILMRDIWTNRLNAVFPGGNFLMLSEDGDESLGSYQFPSGVKLVISDGVAVYHDQRTSKRFTAIALLARGGKRALFLGVRDPVALAAALDSGAEVLAVDPHPRYADLLKSLADGPWPPAGGKLAIAAGGLRRHLERPGPGYDVIVLEPPVPADSPKAAFLLTGEGLARISKRLSPDGILAVPLVSPVRTAWLARTLAVFGESFPHAVLIELESRRLILASPSPLPKVPELLRRLPPPLGLSGSELAALRDAGGSLSPNELRECPLPEGGHPKAGAALETDDRPRNAFPLAEILSSGPSVAR